MKKLLSAIALFFICSFAFSQITITSTVTNASCFGQSNGSATITASGGSGAPYTYSITAPPQSNGTGVFTGLMAGTYTIIVQDIAATTESLVLTIGEPSQMTLNVTSTPALCNGTSTGTINITSVIGGNPFYQYNLNGGAYTVSTLFPNVPTGVYLAGVQDASGCIATQTVLVTEPTQLNSVTNVNNARCFGTATGTISATGTGGTAPYSYIWPSISSTLSTVPNVAIGTYTVIVTDANGCVTGNSVTVLQPTQLIATTTATNANCGQANGSACINVTGGNPAYFYYWDIGSNTTCNTNIPAGVHSYTVVDVNGCVFAGNTIINNIGGPIVSITSQTNNSCFGSCNGVASASITAGTAPFTYSWSNGSSVPTVTNLCAGIYTVNVTDFSGCIGTASVNITQPTALNVFINPNNPSCFGQCNGSASAAAFGGTPPYTYAWTGGAGNMPTTNPLCAGNYGITVTDANGCIATSSVSVINPPALTTSITSINGTCGSVCNGSAQINVANATGVCTFSSTGPVNIITSNPTNLCVGIYTVTTTDQNGCSFTNMLNINSLGSNTITNVTAISTSYDETCLQTNDGAIDISITGSNLGPFTYQWNNGATTQDLNNISSNNYWVTILDGNSNCLILRDTVNAIGTNCGSISGNVYFDNNSDCIKNAGDNSFNNALVVINPGNKLGYTNVNGDYIINNLPFGTYSITSTITNSIYVATCSTSLSATINSTTPNISNKNFVREFSPIAQPDMYASAWSQGIVPGFVCRVNYLLYNYNTFNASGVFKVTLPSAFIPNITNASPATYTLSGDTIIWNFANISYTGWNPNFYVDFTTPLSTPLGSIFTTCMWAQPTVTDLNYANNNPCYSRYVTGSFDPNDKTVNPVGAGPNGDIAATETDLTYLIRFQNTGNGPAVNIVVKDTLSPNVDVNTFEMLGSSHNYNIEILPGNILKWKFNNIMLPDSNSNEPASHGYIQYRIKRTNNNTPGTQIKNTAYIYFDFNEPVVTNTAINTIETITGIKSSSTNNNEWNVYPNPSTGVLYIVNSSSVKEESQIQVINSIGQTVLDETINSNYKNIDLSKLNNGVYFVKIVSDKQSVIKRVVLSK